MRRLYTWGLTAGWLVALAGCGDARVHEDVGATAQAVLGDTVTTRVLGFESLVDWSILQGPGALSQSTTKTQGSYALQVANPSYTVIKSAALSTLGNVGNTLTFDLQVPAALAWGGAQVLLSSPTAGIYDVYLGQQALTGIPAGYFVPLSFTIPADTITRLQSVYSDLVVKIVLNVPASAGAFKLDNVRFPNATSTNVTSIQPQSVFGQNDLTETSVNQIGPNRVFKPGGVVIDRRTTPNHMFVFDSGNQRVLGYKSLGTCSGGTTPNAACTQNSDCAGTGASCNLGAATRNADIIIGQKDGATGTCNGDNSQSLPASASTLCSIAYPRTISVLESPEVASMAVDSSGNLYMPDKWNHRVLRYKDPLGTPNAATGVGDKVADFVWGQSDFSSRACNRGLAAPTASTLCLSDELTNIHLSGDKQGGGVDVAPDGSVWIADVANNRVLRFPANSQTADRVFGQGLGSAARFDTNARGDECDANQAINTGANLCWPKVVRYNVTTNQLFVVDWKHGERKHRVLIYNKPANGDFTNGMAPSEILVGDQCLGNTCENDTLLMSDAKFRWRRPTGLDFPVGVADAFWLNDGGMSRATYFTKQAGVWSAKKVLSQRNLTEVGDDNVHCPAPYQNNDCHVENPSGSLGIDSGGNLYMAESSWPRVVRFSTNNLPNAQQGPGVGESWPNNGVVFPLIPGLSSALNGNNVTASHFAVAGNHLFVSYPASGGVTPPPQLVVSDANRVVFWNNYATRGSGNDADGVLYQASLTQQQDIGTEVHGLASDSKGHVFITRGNTLEVFQGPLATGAVPTIVTMSEIPLRQGGSLVNVNASSIAYDEANDALFVSDWESARILRIRNPLGTAGKPSRAVDLVLGQRDANSRQANRSFDVWQENGCFNVQPDGFGKVGQIRLDRLGNLFVVDAGHEGWQCSNNRVVEYDKAQLVPDATRDFFCDALSPTCTYARAPKRVYVAGSPSIGYPDTSKSVLERRGSGPICPQDGCFWVNNGDDAPNIPIHVNFDANNRMIMVMDGYGNPNNKRVFYYANPLPTCSDPKGCFVPHTKVFPAINSQPQDVAFDANNNLAILDHTWNRILFYKSSDVTAWLSSN